MDGSFFTTFIPFFKGVILLYSWLFLHTPISSTGARWHEELQVRLFCREVLLDTWSGQLDRQLWLTMFLTPWPIVSQARLLFILYGPLHPGGEINLCAHFHWDYYKSGLKFSSLSLSCKTTTSPTTSLQLLPCT